MFQSYLNKLILDDSQRQIRKVETESCGKESEEDVQNKIMELELKCVRLKCSLRDTFLIFVFILYIFFRIIILAN